jgi:hypothetical protein
VRGWWTVSLSKQQPSPRRLAQSSTKKLCGLHLRSWLPRVQHCCAVEPLSIATVTAVVAHQFPDRSRILGGAGQRSDGSADGAEEFRRRRWGADDQLILWL